MFTPGLLIHAAGWRVEKHADFCAARLHAPQRYLTPLYSKLLKSTRTWLRPLEERITETSSGIVSTQSLYRTRLGHGSEFGRLATSPKGRIMIPLDSYGRFFSLDIAAYRAREQYPSSSRCLSTDDYQPLLTMCHFHRQSSQILFQFAVRGPNSIGFNRSRR